MDTIEKPDWQAHTTDDECPLCSDGYPHPCTCGGFVHGEVVAVPDDGFVQLTHCAQCGEPELV